MVVAMIAVDATGYTEKRSNMNSCPRHVCGLKEEEAKCMRTRM